MKIGILGSRGIPNRYGGFEQFAEHLASGLAALGAEVWVYCSSQIPDRKNTYNGVRLIYCHDPEHRLGTIGQFIYDLHCIRDSRKRDFDIIYQLGYTSSSVWHRLLPQKPVIVTNMDGLEWSRSKYRGLVRRFLQYAEKLAAEHSNILIADAMAIKHYLDTKYQTKSHYLAYGAAIFDKPDQGSLTSFQVEPYNYFLLIARMQPDNHIAEIIEGVLQSNSQIPLLVVGNTHNSHGNYLKRKYQHPQIKFAGAIFEQELLNNLRYHSALYFHGHSAGGTNPSLLEAMAASALICAHDNVFNREVLGDNAAYFSEPADIVKIINEEKFNQSGHPFTLINKTRIAEKYNWNAIIQAYYHLFEKLLNKSD